MEEQNLSDEQKQQMMYEFAKQQLLDNQAPLANRLKTKLDGITKSELHPTDTFFHVNDKTMTVEKWVYFSKRIDTFDYIFFGDDEQIKSLNYLEVDKFMDSYNTYRSEIDAYKRLKIVLLSKAEEVSFNIQVLQEQLYL